MSTVVPIQGPVEARSLSSITTIASNPPAYPRNPTHEKLDPLQLYIVRVPGSQGMYPYTIIESASLRLHFIVRPTEAAGLYLGNLC
jgi:hypothetical protein